MSLKFYRQQTDYTCGAASMRMILESVGIIKSEKEIARIMETNEESGTWNKDFPKLAEEYKLNYSVKRNASLKNLKEYHKKGYKIIVCYYLPNEDVSHYAVLNKIDSKKVYLYDPEMGPNHKYSLKEFNKLWSITSKHDKERNWMFAIKKS